MSAKRPLLSLLSSSLLALASALGCAGVAAAEPSLAALPAPAPTAAEQAQRHAQQRLFDAAIGFEAADRRVNAAHADLQAAERSLADPPRAQRTATARKRLEAQLERARAVYAQALARAAAAKADLDLARDDAEHADMNLAEERERLAALERAIRSAAPAAIAESH